MSTVSSSLVVLLTLQPEPTCENISPLRVTVCNIVKKLSQNFRESRISEFQRISESEFQRISEKVEIEALSDLKLVT